MSVYETIMQRRTIRKFGQKPLAKQQLLKYIDAARVAASGANLQPLKYVIINEPAQVSHVFDMVRWAAYIAPEGTPKEGERPTAFIAVLADLSIKEKGYDVDVGAAVTNLMLTAWEEGVGCCWMGAIDYDGISALLGLEDHLKLTCVVALGEIAEQPVRDEVPGGVKYYKDDDGTLHVPKRPLDEIVLSDCGKC